jgi:ribosomal protein S18 acetylase RimI-like enzyme
MPRASAPTRRTAAATRLIAYPGRATQRPSDDIEIRDVDPAAGRAGFEQFLAAYLELFNDLRSVRQTRLTLRPYQEDAVRAWLKRVDAETHRLLTAFDVDGRIVGMQVVALDADDGFELQRIAVRPDLRRRGIARALVGHAVGLAAELGYRAADTQVFVDNAPMLKLLVHSGFVPVDMLFNARADGCDMLWLRRPLDPGGPVVVLDVADDRTMPPATAPSDRKTVGAIPQKSVTITECYPDRDPGQLDELIAAGAELFNDADGVNRMSITLKPWSHEVLRHWLTDGGEYHCLEAVNADNNIVGAQIVSIDHEGVAVEALGVTPAMRRRGIGRQLVNRAVDAAAERGYRAVDARVFVDNPAIIALLLDAEFVPVNLRFHARADGCDVMWMRKYLPPR